MCVVGVEDCCHNTTAVLCVACSNSDIYIYIYIYIHAYSVQAGATQFFLKLISWKNMLLPATKRGRVAWRVVLSAEGKLVQLILVQWLFLVQRLALLWWMVSMIRVSWCGWCCSRSILHRTPAVHQEIVRVTWFVLWCMSCVFYVCVVHSMQSLHLSVLLVSGNGDDIGEH